MSVDLETARREHDMLLSIVNAQIRHADPGPVESFALLAVRDLLEGHSPAPWEDHSTALMCRACWDTWPCDVYQVIEVASHHGE